VPNTGALTAKVPEEIDAETIYEFYRTREVSLEDVAELQRMQATRRAERQVSAGSERSEESE